MIPQPPPHCTHYTLSTILSLHTSSLQRWERPSHSHPALIFSAQPQQQTTTTTTPRTPQLPHKPSSPKPKRTCRTAHTPPNQAISHPIIPAHPSILIPLLRRYNPNPSHRSFFTPAYVSRDNFPYYPSDPSLAPYIANSTILPSMRVMALVARPRAVPRVSSHIHTEQPCLFFYQYAYLSTNNKNSRCVIFTAAPAII